MARAPISTDFKIFLAGLLYIPILVLGLLLIVAGNTLSPFTKAASWVLVVGSIAGPFWLRRRLRRRASARNDDVAYAEPHRMSVSGPDAQNQQHSQSARIGSQELQNDRGKAATKPCPFCAEEILVAAIKCKHCGSTLNASTAMPNPAPAARQTNAQRPTLGRDSIFALLVIGVATWWWLSDKRAVERPSTSLETTAVVTATAPPGPSQARFCEFVQGFSHKYREAERMGANEAELSELRFSRKQAFPLIMGGGTVTGWTGILKSIGTHSDGSASIRVLLACGDKPRPNDPVVADIEDFAGDNVRLLHIAAHRDHGFHRIMNADSSGT
jgi:hypothetical protein